MEFVDYHEASNSKIISLKCIDASLPKKELFLNDKFNHTVRV